MTPAGVSRYLERPSTFENGLGYKEHQLEEKIKAVWKNVDLEPHLIRQSERNETKESTADD